MAQRRDAFSKRDLGLLLPDDTPGDPVSLRHTKTKYVVAVVGAWALACDSFFEQHTRC